MAPTTYGWMVDVRIAPLIRRSVTQTTSLIEIARGGSSSLTAFQHPDKEALFG